MTRRKLLAFSGLGVLLLAAVLVVVLAPRSPKAPFLSAKKPLKRRVTRRACGGS